MVRTGWRHSPTSNSSASARARGRPAGAVIRYHGAHLRRRFRLSKRTTPRGGEPSISLRLILL